MASTQAVLGRGSGVLYQRKVLHPGESLDGYRLLRLVGSGGFGEIWICRSEALGDLSALKFVPSSSAGRLEREFHALGLYRNASGRLRSPALMPIEHANLRPDGLFYIMPLADGISAGSPDEQGWQPATLASVILRQQKEPAWFTSQQVQKWIHPILEGLQLLSDAGLVHRDVKPENILFLNGAPCLSDISLLGEDAQQLTPRGTPGFSAPSWFVESGGHPDMYGAAMTLYSLLSGNPPDKMGRANFRWPPQGEQSLSLQEREAWLGMHAAIRRAIDDRPAERFADFAQFARALATPLPAPAQDSAETPTLSERLHPKNIQALNRKMPSAVLFAGGIGFGILLLGFGASKLSHHGAQWWTDWLQRADNERAKKDSAMASKAPPSAQIREMPGPRTEVRPEIQDFEAELARNTAALTFSRENFEAQMESIAADLYVLDPDNGPAPNTQKKPLSEIKERFVSSIRALPNKPSVSTRNKVLSDLRAAASYIGSKYGADAATPLEEKIRKLESELNTDAEFRKEQGMRVLRRATKLVNIMPESWSIIQPAQNFSFNGEL